MWATPVRSARARSRKASAARPRSRPRRIATRPTHVTCQRERGRPAALTRPCPRGPTRGADTPNRKSDAGAPDGLPGKLPREDRGPGGGEPGDDEVGDLGAERVGGLTSDEAGQNERDTARAL